MATEPQSANRAVPADRQSDRWLHAFIGAVVTVVTAFIPFSPAIGGGVAGYLQKGSDRDGLRIGAVSGLIASIPILAIFGLVVAVMFLGMAVFGEFGGPLFVVVILLIIAMFVVGYTVVLSAIGGFVGAAIAASRSGTPPSDER